jgi:FMN phosphatase YigB (HAD superfamily)
MIHNVVFDVGGVLLGLHYQPFIQYVTEAGADLSDLRAWLEEIGLEAHERGEISGPELLVRVAASARRPLDPQELKARWLDMFERKAEMFDLVSGLMDDYRVFLLSNVGDMHWSHFESEYGLAHLSHGAMPSFRVGAAKPSAAIYRAAERRFGLEPAATVFVDDLEPNVAGARACGWNAIHHASPADTRRALRALGVRLPAMFGDP